MERTYVCIDLKSFYASVECVDRGLDRLTANLVVADPDRTEKTICLHHAVHEALGLSSRCRVFEIPENVTTSWRSRACSATWSVGRHLLHLPALRVARGRPSLFHRRMLHRCDAVPVAVPDERPGVAVMLMEAVLAETGVRATAGSGRPARPLTRPSPKSPCIPPLFLV